MISQLHNTNFPHWHKKAWVPCHTTNVFLRGGGGCLNPKYKLKTEPKVYCRVSLFSYRFHSSRKSKRFPNPRRWPLPLTQHQNHLPKRLPTLSMRNDPRTLESVSICWEKFSLVVVVIDIIMIPLLHLVTYFNNFYFIYNWVIPENVHTSPTEDIGS